METSQIFLLVWAIVATVLAVVFKHLLSTSMQKLFMFHLALELLAEGKAEVVKENDKIQVRAL